MTTPLSKLVVARRQLATAVELYFADRDLVSVYSLAANAWEIIDALCAREGVNSLSNQTRGHVPGDRDLKSNYVNSPYRNFFKHADRDPEQSLEGLSPSHVEGLLYLAVEDYIRLNRRSPVQFQVFQLWYLAKHPDKLDPSVAAELKRTLTEAFPDLPAKSRSDRVSAGADTLARALQDEEVLRDPRTESAFE